MVKQPFFSIITVVLNGDQYLERTIQSVINQSFQDFEYIIIDGGSTDRTIEIIQQYKEQVDFWVSEHDEGISDGFNKGIKQANGRYIGFINADDYYTEDAFAIVHKLAIESEEVGVFCGAVNFYDGKKFLISSPSDIDRIRIESTIHQSSSFIKNSLFDEYMPFDIKLRYAMDYELFLRFYMEKIKFSPIPAILSERDINGTTLENSYKALAELRQIRTLFFGKLEASFNYYFFTLKLALGRFLRERFLFIYKIYWRLSA